MSRHLWGDNVDVTTVANCSWAQDEINLIKAVLLV
jgi:hypothetical protein